MIITILLSTDVDPTVSDLILGHKLEGGYSIDYALNSLVSYYQGREIEVFNFSEYLRLDNRWSSYEIQDYGTKINIKFI